MGWGSYYCIQDLLREGGFRVLSETKSDEMLRLEMGLSVLTKLTLMIQLGELGREWSSRKRWQGFRRTSFQARLAYDILIYDPPCRFRRDNHCKTWENN
jgi:hypothetical protein